MVKNDVLFTGLRGGGMKLTIFVGGGLLDRLTVKYSVVNHHEL